MSDNTNPFDFDSDPNTNPGLSPTSPPEFPPLVPPRETNVQRIQTNRIRGPLVVFFGPPDIGKTVTLLRLCAYIRESFRIRPDTNFRTDSGYTDTLRAFENMMDNSQFAPNATGGIDFLLLDINTNDGNTFCQILEAPGEHFFNRSNPNEPYPAYMNSIFSSDYKKIFIFFFELGMFRSDKDLTNYSDKIARLINKEISPRRDRIIILCNKCDIQQYFRGGKPIKAEYQNALYNHPSFRQLKDALQKGGFGHIPFIPFSSGSFNDDGEGNRVLTPAPEHYPKTLWQEIYNSIKGSWFRFW